MLENMAIAEYFAAVLLKIKHNGFAFPGNLSQKFETFDLFLMKTFCRVFVKPYQS